MRLFLLVLSVTGLAALAPSTSAAEFAQPTCSVATLVIVHGVCQGGCSGVTVIVGASDACEGKPGAPGEAGGKGCEGVAVIVGGDRNCRGGSGGSGGGAGGAGCDASLVVGDENCRGGDGGSG